jgi:3-oxoacyl-[acyl-carrier protein] reductase
MRGRLADRSAIVTGGVRGIGKGVAQVLAAEGANVLLVGLHEDSGAKAASEIKGHGSSVEFFKADVSDTDQVSAMARHAKDRFGGIDILCGNAGIYPSVLVEDMTEEDWDRVHDVNLKGTFLAVQACLPYMKERSYGRIVLISSITGPITGFPGWAHYGSTKAGMLGFMRTAALEFAKYNVTVNAVLPGNIKTESLDDLGEDYMRQMEQSIPMMKLGEPADVAYCTLFLASDEAKYITGQSIVVDGGQVLPESLLAMT